MNAQEAARTDRSGRYLAFGGNYYYPDGGWDDFRGASASPSEAEDVAISAVIGDFEVAEWSEVVDGWWQVVDLETMKIVRGSPGQVDGDEALCQTAEGER